MAIWRRAVVSPTTPRQPATPSAADEQLRAAVVPVQGGGARWHGAGLPDHRLRRQVHSIVQQLPGGRGSHHGGAHRDVQPVEVRCPGIPPGRPAAAAAVDFRGRGRGALRVPGRVSSLVCVRHRRTGERIHAVTGALLLFNALKLVCAAEDQWFVERTGTPHGWDFAFYVFGFFKVILFFTMAFLFSVDCIQRH